MKISLNISAKRRLTAIAIAMADSVTVSMGEEMRGVFNVIFLVSADVRSWEESRRERAMHISSLTKRSLFLLFCTWATRGQTETLLSWKWSWVILLYLKQPHLPSTSSHNNQHQILLYSAVCVCMWENNILSTWEISKWACIQDFAPYLCQT